TKEHLQKGEDVDEQIKTIEQTQQILESKQSEIQNVKEQIRRLEPWGNFSIDIIQKLHENRVLVRFFAIPKKQFTKRFQQKYHAEMISEDHQDSFFLVVQIGDWQLIPDASEVEIPIQSLNELKQRQLELKAEIDKLNQKMDQLATTGIPLLKDHRNTLQSTIEFEQVVEKTGREFDEKLMVLEGWVPTNMRKKIDQYLEQHGITYLAARPTPNDQVPVLLSNNRFSRLFEPIGNLFSLPAYYELDLTVFFAPFFMLFFGFCLGDAGYGLLFIVGAGIYKLRASKSIKPYLSLIQFLGVATFLLGLVSGTFFGINLIEADFNFTQQVREQFLNPNEMFNLALLLGAAQIIFGLALKAANQIRQFGVKYALGTIGWLVIILGGGAFQVLDLQTALFKIVLVVGGILVMFFSDPQGSIFSRIGKGVWSVYSTVTGVFGDLLSYIRLFALGLSSAILGFVVNEIALQILQSSPVVGPVFFVLFLLLGHTLNILISSLGSFVHPMRLTFVEFYKNAGFVGGGTAYKPFAMHKNHST
ncbi:MAG TPA: V-type ATPase 116kDa subunit family protein, partial [Sunxiuqinia sp.]|nr:V-type ATPase 116kDa subunit family protein [Sunxiuqinia sp.]